jgi:hypothetical protein
MAGRATGKNVFMKTPLSDKTFLAGCEKAFLWDPAQEPFPAGAAGRLYIGDEFCERRMPSSGELKTLRSHASAAGLPVTLLTPYLSEKGIGVFEELLSGLASGAGSEVVINDWGALKAAGSFLSDGIVLGRLLVSSYLTKTAASSLFPEPFLDFLESRNIRRLEFNAPEHLAAARPQLARRGFKAHLYWPYAYATTSRCCSAASGYVACVTDPGQPCAHECAHSVAVMRRGPGARPFYVRGNAYFTREDKKSLSPRAFPDRIVFNDFFQDEPVPGGAPVPKGSCR